MSRSKALWILLLIACVGVGLRSYELTARSLWFDEAFSWRLIQFPMQDMMARAAADVHPPLYYILLRGWGEVFGTSLLALRSFSVVFAGATIAALYGFAAYAARSRAVGLLAASLLAVSGWQIAFAWEARMYTLGTFLAVVATWLLLRAVRQTRQYPWWWVGYGIAAAAFAYTHYFAFFTLAAHALFVMAVTVTRTRWRVGEILQWPLTWFALLAGLVAGGLYAPWIPVFIAQNAQVQEAYWVPSIGGWSIPDTFYRMFVPTSGIPPHTGAGIFLAILPILTAFLIWGGLLLGYRRRQDADARWLIALSGAVPFVLTIAVSFLGQSLYQDRFLVFSNIFIVTGLAAVIMRLPGTAIRRTVGAAALAGLVLSAGAFWRELDIAHKGGAHSAVQAVMAQRTQEEPITATSPFIFFAVLHYAQEEFEGAGMPKLYSATGELLHFAGGPILTADDLISPAELDRFPSVWLIETSGFGSRELALPPTWVRTHHQAYPEVFAHQGEVFINRYERR